MKKGIRFLSLILALMFFFLSPAGGMKVQAYDLGTDDDAEPDRMLLEWNPYGVDEKLIATTKHENYADENVPYQVWSINGRANEKRTFVLSKMFRNMADNGTAYLMSGGYLCANNDRKARCCLEFYDDDGRLIKSDTVETDELFEPNAISMKDYQIPPNTAKFKVWYNTNSSSDDDSIVGARLIISNGKSLLSTKGGWMKDIPDNTPIMHINLPGSHDAGTCYIAAVKQNMGRTQDMDITTQLNAGLRFFDLRYKVNDGTVEGGKKERNIFIYHGDWVLIGLIECTCYEDPAKTVQLRLSRCLEKMNNFLERNPYDYTICRMNSEGEQQDAWAEAQFYKILKENHVIQLVDHDPTPAEIARYTYEDKDGKVKPMVYNSHKVTLGQLRGHVVNGNYEYIKDVGSEPVDRDHYNGYWYTKIPELNEIFNWARNIDGPMDDPMTETKPRATYWNVDCRRITHSIRERSRKVRKGMSAYPFQFGKAYQIQAMDYAYQGDISTYIETNKYLTNKNNPYSMTYNWYIKNGTLYIKDTPEYDAAYRGQLKAETVYNNMNDVPWSAYRSQIQNVVIDTNMQPVSTAFWFKDCRNLKKVTINNFDWKRSVSIESLYENCSALTDIDMSEDILLKESESMETFKMESMKNAFRNCKSLKEVDTGFWDTSRVKDMAHIFDGCETLKTLDVRNWTVTSIESMAYAFRNCKNLEHFETKNDGETLYYNGTDFSHMFEGCSSLQTIGLGSWNIYKAENIAAMFKGCSSLETLELDKWTFYNVEDASEMFSGCTNIKNIDVSSFNLSKALDIHGMFAGCKNLEEIDVSDWVTRNVKDMSEVFSYCQNLKELNLLSWKTGNVESMTGMFEGCNSIKELDISSFSSLNLTDFSNMFYGCSSLGTIKASYRWKTTDQNASKDVFNGCNMLYGGKGTGYNPENVDGRYANVDGYQNKPGYFTDIDVQNEYVYWGIYQGQLMLSNKEITEKELSGIFSDYVPDSIPESMRGKFPATTAFTEQMPAPWQKFWKEIVTVRAISLLKPMNTSHWFDGLKSLVAVDFNEANFAENADFSYMFNNCTSLWNIKTHDWDTRNAQFMNSMFAGCQSLDSLDCSDWDVSKVTDFRDMFYGCQKLAFVDVATWNTSSATDMSAMFEACTNLQLLEVNNWDVSHVKDFSEMFDQCESLKNIPVNTWNTASAENFAYMFANCKSVVEFYLEGFVPDHVTDFSGMFNSCLKLKNIFVKDTWVLKKDQKDDDMFGNCPLLRTKIVIKESDPTPTPTPTPTPDPIEKTVKNAKVKLTSVKVGKRRATVTVNKVPYATGYQVAYRIAKKGTKFKNVYTKTNRMVIVKLKKNKKYYVKVRAFTQVGNMKVFSAWTKVKKTKTIK